MAITDLMANRARRCASTRQLRPQDVENEVYLEGVASVSKVTFQSQQLSCLRRFGRRHRARLTRAVGNQTPTAEPCAACVSGIARGMPRHAPVGQL